MIHHSQSRLLTARQWSRQSKASSIENDDNRILKLISSFFNFYYFLFLKEKQTIIRKYRYAELLEKDSEFQRFAIRAYENKGSNRPIVKNNEPFDFISSKMHQSNREST